MNSAGFKSQRTRTGASLLGRRDIFGYKSRPGSLDDSMTTSTLQRLGAQMRALCYPHRNAQLKGSRIRVVINALHAKSGGGVTYLRNLLPLLAGDERLELHVFLHASQIGLFHPIDERIVVHLFDFPGGLLRLILWEQWVLPLMVRVMSADVVFSPANFGSLPIRNQVILLRNALAVARTETRFAKRFYWFALGLITFLSLVRCRRAIAVSRYAATSLSLGFSRIFAGKTRVIHHGVDVGFTPAPQVAREGFLLAVSDIYVQKNLHNLFRAMRIVCDRFPGIRLKIAGQCIDQWYYDAGIALAAELGVAGNIEFLGRLPVSDLACLYQRCRLFVFPSTAETFGMPLVEAMACGAPVVSSSSTAMPEIVGDAALLFNPFDPQDIARTILAALADDGLRTSLSERSLLRAQQFSWRRTAAATSDVLAEASPRRCG